MDSSMNGVSVWLPDEYGSKYIYILTAIKTQVFSLHDESYLRLFMKVLALTIEACLCLK